MFLHSHKLICEMFCQLRGYFPEAPILNLNDLPIICVWINYILYMCNSREFGDSSSVSHKPQVGNDPQFEKLCNRALMKKHDKKKQEPEELCIHHFFLLPEACATNNKHRLFWHSISAL